jgi:hypothetical protein
VAPLGWKDGKPQVGRGLRLDSPGKAVQPRS